MSREEKIDFLIKRLGDRFTKKHLETKPDRFIDNLYRSECLREDREMDAMLNSF